MEWKDGPNLKPGMHRNPILRWQAVDWPLPRITNHFMVQLFGEGTSKRIQTWGHDGDALSPHWLAVRGGTPIHTDPAYARYSVQLQLLNQGFYTHGVDILESGGHPTDDNPIMVPGVVVLLDTHSPHKVSRDPRLPNTGHCKMGAAIDSVELPDWEATLQALERKVRGQRPMVPTTTK